MDWHRLIPFAPLLVLLTWAAAGDLRTRRIPNWLTLAIALTGLGQCLLDAGTVTAGQAGLGFLVGLGLPFLLFAIGALGGGDVKLLAGIGIWVGPLGALYVFAAAAVIGMVIVVVQALCTGKLLKLVRNSALVAVNVVHVRQVGVEHASDTGRSCRTVDKPLPYAVPALAATLFVLYVMTQGGRA